MIQTLPPEIAQLDIFPPNFPIWWVRGIVLDVREVERPTGDDKLKHLRDTHIQVGDVDNPKDGYDLRIEGNWHNIEPNDAVSLLGHERKGAQRVSFPRLFINHHTGEYRRAYPPAARLPYGVLPIVEHKYWLAGKLPAAGASKLLNLWKLVAALCIPSLILWGVGGPLFALLFLIALLLLALPWIVAAVLLGLYVRWLLSQPRFTWEEKNPPPLFAKNILDYLNFVHFDMTPMYQVTAEKLIEWARKNPAPELEWVPAERGAHTVGLLKS